MVQIRQDSLIIVYNCYLFDGTISENNAQARLSTCQADESRHIEPSCIPVFAWFCHVDEKSPLPSGEKQSGVNLGILFLVDFATLTETSSS
jgi:hypothetical protein